MRILVDRLWPRGLNKEDAHLDLWAKTLAPSSPLRIWFHRNPRRFAEFRRRYLLELRERDGELSALKLRSTKRPLTLLYAARNEEANHALILEEAIRSAKLPTER
jgi:uncharacterized protein YeaO (DUF488 family)